MVFVDLETRSRADLPTVGGRAYARHESTEVLCGAVVVGSRVVCWSSWPGPARIQRPAPPPPPRGAGVRPWSTLTWDVYWEREDPPFDLRDATLVAHNAHGFDRHVWAGMGWGGTQWADTIDLARRCALPGRLEDLAQAVYGQGKDSKGRKLMLGHSTPWRATKSMLYGEFRDPAPASIGAIVSYCARDAVLLACLWYDLRLGDKHGDDEALEVHNRINDRGIPVDLPYVRRLAAAEQRIRDAAVAKAAEHVDVASQQKLLKWLQEHGVRVDDVQRETLAAVQSKDPAVLAVLAARGASANVVKGKLESILARVCPDGRVRGAHAYYGAHTGRWSGRGPQFQNFPKAQ